MKFTTYYVLNGLLNGERGVSAQRTDGIVQVDGHYWIGDGEIDGHGPFTSVDDAQDAARTQWWIFQTDQLPRPVTAHQIESDLGPGDVARIVEQDHHVFRCDIQGSYETLSVTVSAKDFAHAARVFSAALSAMEV